MKVPHSKAGEAVMFQLESESRHSARLILSGWDGYGE
jgi:hypothetical protein